MHLCGKSKIPTVAQIRMPRLDLLQPNVKNINGTHTSSVNYIAVLSVHEDGVPHVVCAFVMLSTHHEANLQRWGLVCILSKCFTLNYFPSLQPMLQQSPRSPSVYVPHFQEILQMKLKENSSPRPPVPNPICAAHCLLQSSPPDPLQASLA